MDRIEQHRHIATLQRTWRAQAMRDYNYNLQRAAEERRAGNRVLSKAYMKEAQWDLQWGNRRRAIANREQSLSK